MIGLKPVQIRTHSKNMSESKIFFIDRATNKIEVEKVYKESYLKFLYGNHFFSRSLGKFVLPFFIKNPLFSNIYGFIQKQSFTTSKIRNFINEFHVDETEFEQPVSAFRSFNDFFIRKLKPEARPIAQGENRAIIPADGRYYFYQNLANTPGFIVKNEKFSLEALLQDQQLAQEYQAGSMVLARLCPSDYHRFHFPCDCVPGQPRRVNGYLYSVNPMAVKQNIRIFTENKRVITVLKSREFGDILYIEIGATNVGTIKETFLPHQPYAKGDEKGYFEFGGSALILLFKEGAIQFDNDLMDATNRGVEIRCLLGQSLGVR